MSLFALLRAREFPGPLDAAVCWASSVISTAGGGGRQRQAWQGGGGGASPGGCTRVHPCCLYSAHGRARFPRGRATELPHAPM